MHREARHPMLINGLQLVTASGRNIQSCGPHFVHQTIELCLSHLPKGMADNREILSYDPLCGNGVIPTEFRANFSDTVRHIFASDVSREAVRATEENLALFNESPTPADVFHHNALQPLPGIIPDASLNLVLTDPPYGAKCHWVDEKGHLSTDAMAQSRFLATLIDNLTPQMSEQSVIGIIIASRIKIDERIGAFECVGIYPITGHSLIDTRNLYVMKPISGS